MRLSHAVSAGLNHDKAVFGSALFINHHHEVKKGGLLDEKNLSAEKTAAQKSTRLYEKNG